MPELEIQIGNSRLTCMPFRAVRPGRLELGKIAITGGWLCSRTIDFIFGRIFSLDIKSPWARQMSMRLRPLSKAALRSGAMNAARSISINLQKC
jgi:hypothetical protein